MFKPKDAWGKIVLEVLAYGDCGDFYPVKVHTYILKHPQTFEKIFIFLCVCVTYLVLLGL